MFPLSLLITVWIIGGALARVHGEYRDESIETFSNLMKVPLGRCHVIAYTRSIHGYNGNIHAASKRHDLEMEHVTLVELNTLGIPVTFIGVTLSDVILGERSSSVKPDMVDRGSNCRTYLTFLKHSTATLSDKTGKSLLSWLSFARRNYSAEDDYAILGIQTPSNVPIEIPFPKSFSFLQLPENLLILKYSMGDTYLKSLLDLVHRQRRDMQNRLQKQLYSIHRIGSVQIFCPHKKRICIDWHNVEAFPTAFFEDSNLFHSVLCPRSSYHTAHNYNYNRFKILLTPYTVYVMNLHKETLLLLKKYPITYRTARKAPGRTAARSSKDGTFGSTKEHVLGIWYMQMVAKLYNTSLHSEGPHRMGYRSMFLKYDPFLLHVNFTYFRYILKNYDHYNFFCTSKRLRLSDFKVDTIFKTMDASIWVTLSVTLVVISVILRKKIDSPILSLLLVLLSQGIVMKSGMRFRYMVGMWLGVGFFINTIFLAHFESSLVAPSETKTAVSTFEEMQKQGYTLVRGPTPSTPDLATIGTQSFQNLSHIKALRASQVHKKWGRGGLKFLRYITKRPKTCVVVSISEVDATCIKLNKLFPDSKSQPGKASILRHLEVMSVAHPNGGVLYGGLQNLEALGLFSFWESLLRWTRVFPFFYSDVFFVSRKNIYRHDESIYVFTFRNPEAFGLVYTCGLALTASIVVFCGEIGWKHIKVFLPQLISAWACIKNGVRRSPITEMESSDYSRDNVESQPIDVKILDEANQATRSHPPTLVQ